MKKTLTLAIAVLAILFGLYGLAGNLASDKTQVTKEAKKPAELNLVIWRLNQPVEAGQLVERKHFSVIKLPESEANSLGILVDVELNFEKGAVYQDDLITESIFFKESIINPSDDGYVDLTIANNRVPYAIKVPPESVVGGVITHGSMIDVLSLSLPSTYSLEASETSSSRKRNMFVTPVLMNVKVLKVDKQTIIGTRNQADTTEVSLILELTRKQVATLTVAKRISEIEVHKSIGEYKKSDLHADAGDVLNNFKSVVEYRAEKVTIN
ncbi:Flp pilus assembly protein CpaB [Vibrio kagoshimensis]|uniref:Flp pilus assembly protein CpaB n=1 Tax=Vibrio kagoshimensis TaxID=2910244 RepID=UPI003D19A1EE